MSLVNSTHMLGEIIKMQVKNRPRELVEHYHHSSILAFEVTVKSTHLAHIWLDKPLYNSFELFKILKVGSRFMSN